MIAPIPPNHVDPRARSFDPSKRCEYHSNAQGHNVEDCRALKREIERMIQEGIIVVQGSNTPTVTRNPLQVHDNTQIVGVVGNDKGLVKGVKEPLGEINDIEIGTGLGNIDVELSG